MQMEHKAMLVQVRLDQVSSDKGADFDPDPVSFCYQGDHGGIIGGETDLADRISSLINAGWNICKSHATEKFLFFLFEREKKN